MDPLYLVRLAGIEPTTPWFVAKYSIQLSYSREEVRLYRGFKILQEFFYNSINLQTTDANIQTLKRTALVTQQSVTPNKGIIIFGKTKTSRHFILHHHFCDADT